MNLAWLWLSAPNTYAHGLPWSETVKHTGKLELCSSGLHASERAIDSLQHAPGPIVCRVECSGEIVRGNDKLVCTERRVLWQRDATEVLRKFARLCALDVAHLWDMPQVVRKYLETGDESKRAVASAAAKHAAWAAARASARASARAAASSAAWAVASAAASAAARAAARAAAEAAAEAAASAAAEAAASNAASNAARAAQNTRLESMLMELGQ